MSLLIKQRTFEMCVTMTLKAIGFYKHCLLLTTYTLIHFGIKAVHKPCVGASAPDLMGSKK